MSEEAMPSERLCRFIPEARRAIGMSQYRLATLVGVAKSTMSKLENGDMRLTLDVAVTICVTLNIDPTGLWTGEPLTAHPVRTGRASEVVDSEAPE